VRRLVPATLCLAALACGATVALAGGPSHESTVRILDDAAGSPPPMARNYYPHFTGTVRSPKDACERKRRVKLFLKEGGDPVLAGKDRTNDHGR
jgi:hypothetical protein